MHTQGIWTFDGDEWVGRKRLEFLDSEHNHMDGDSRGYVLLEEIEPIRV